MKEGNVLFNDTLIFYLQLYVIERMVKDYAREETCHDMGYSF